MSIDRRSFFRRCMGGTAAAAGLAAFPIKWHRIDRIAEPQEAVEAAFPMRQVGVGFTSQVPKELHKALNEIWAREYERMSDELAGTVFGVDPASPAGDRCAIVARQGERITFAKVCDPESWS